MELADLVEVASPTTGWATTLTAPRSFGIFADSRGARLAARVAGLCAASRTLIVSCWIVELSPPPRPLSPGAARPPDADSSELPSTSVADSSELPAAAMP